MTAASSVKPKNKFSSRNVNALYKAPALRGSGADFGGVSAGFRTGGVNGLNRMLVLRGPVRGGAMGMAEANAVAAPTPINTPSLRKEHMGQDIHVNLVPATKGGGWGSAAHDASKGTEGSTMDTEHRPLPQHAPAAPSADLVHQGPAHAHERPQAWTGDAPAVLVGHAKPPAHAINSILSTGSGRWGDDAVEEDFVQVEVQRDMEHRREFPDLHEQQGSNNQGHAHEHIHPQQSMRHHGLFNPDLQSQESRSHTRMNAPLYDGRSSSGHTQGLSYHHEVRRGYDDHGSSSMHSASSSTNNRDERGHHGQHMSTQDVRYGSGSGFAPNDRYDRAQPRGHQDHPRYCPQGMSTERPYGFHYDKRPLSQDLLHRSDHPPTAQHPSEQGVLTSLRLDSAWRNHPSAVVQSNVWRMSEAEASTRSPPEVTPAISSSNRPFDRITPADTARNEAPVSAVRILKRDGPRMLFDHKSGTMVEVNESQSSRRSIKQTSIQPKVSSESKVQREPTVIESTKEIKSSPPAQVEKQISDIGSGENKASAPVSVITIETNVMTTADEATSTVSSSPTVAQSQVSNSKFRAKEPKTKRVPMGGKMKRVVVAYRPVMKLDATTDSPEKPTSEGKSEKSIPLEDNDKSPSSPEKPNRQPKLVQARRERKSQLSVKTEREENSRRVPFKNSTIVNPVAFDSERSTKFHDTKETKKKPRAAHSETKQKSRIAPVSKSSKAGYRTKNLAPERDISASVSAKDESMSDEIPDDDGGTFTTVKSRRALLLERKKQREQLAAALTGFHQRCDVKRPSNRVTLPASIARFGKRGLLVGFKQKAEMLTAATPLSLPALEKSFIDVIRPPVATRDEGHQLQTSSNKDTEDSEPQMSTHEKREKARANSKRRAKSSTEHIERHVPSIQTQGSAAERVEQKTSSIRYEATVNKVNHHDELPVAESSISGEGAVEAKRQTSTSRQTRPEKHVRRGGTTKEVKRIYVPKVTQVQVTPAILETSTALPAAVSVTTVSPALANGTIPILESKEDVTVKKVGQKTKVKEASSLVKKKDIVSTRSKVSAGVSSSDTPAVEIRSSQKETLNEDATAGSAAIQRTPAKKTKWAKSTKGIDKAPRQRIPSTATVSSSDSSPKQSTIGEPSESTSTPAGSASPPLKAPRRISFKGTSAKSIASNVSSQKIFKQVYVIKTASTAASSSPSAA